MAGPTRPRSSKFVLSQAMKRPLLEFTERGIYCARADVYLDPWRPVPRALITHGHADHSRSGHAQYLTHFSNVPIIRHRLGKIEVGGYEWGETFTVNGVKFSFHPAGHIIGSSQIRVEYRGEVWVFSGDYKTDADGLTTPFEPVPCHTFITECTFGLPVFNWKPFEQIHSEINRWWARNRAEGRTSVIFAYSLGKAQRVLKYLDPSIGTIYTHTAIENMTSVLREQHEFPPTVQVLRQTGRKEIQGNLVLAPPSAHGSPWIRRAFPFVTATASGWMQFRGARRRRAVDQGFILSDHSDWKGLLSAIEGTGAERVICTHGYSGIFSRYLRELGYESDVEGTEFEGENAELDPGRSDTDAEEKTEEQHRSAPTGLAVRTGQNSRQG